MLPSLLAKKIFPLLSPNAIFIPSSDDERHLTESEVFIRNLELLDINNSNHPTSYLSLFTVTA